MVAYDDLLLETPAFQQPASFRSASDDYPEPESETAFGVASQDTGGAAYLSTSADGQHDRALLWEFTVEEPDLLRLSEVSPSHNLSSNALKLRFSSALYPKAVLVATPKGHSLVVLSVTGVLHALQLPHASQLRTGESVLSSLSGPHSQSGGMHSRATVPLQSWAARLGNLTSIAEAAGCIAIGGQSGAVVCVPKSAIGTGSPDGAFELQDSKGLLSSFFARPVGVPVKDLCSISVANQDLLLSVHGDNTLRVWDMAAQRRLFVTALLTEAVGRALTPQRVRIGPPVTMETSVQLLVQFGPANQEDAESIAPQVAMYKLAPKPGLGGFSLDPCGAGLCSLQGYIEDISACHDPTWGNWAWILGGYRQAQLSSITEDGDQGASAVLLGGSPAALSAVPELQDSLWDSVKEELEDGESADEAVTRHVLRRLLVPGELSYKAVSMTLEELGKPVPASELKGQSTSEILDFIVEVIRTQQGSESALSVLERLQNSYQRVWEGLHPPYTLLRHPLTGRISVMRAGPSLHPLRGATPSESMLHDATPTGVIALGDDFAEPLTPTERLVQAARTLTELLGGGLEQAATTWLWQGRSFFDAIVPAFVKALAGPSVTDARFGGGSDRHAGHASSEWRRRRRVAVLQVERLLSPVDDLTQAAIELLRDVVEPPLLPFHSRSLSQEAKAANFASHRHAARTLVQLLQGLLLLVGYLADLRVLGTLDIPEAQLDALVTEVAPQAEAALRQAALLEWLTVTPMEAEPSMDPSALLTQLDLESTPWPRGRERRQLRVREKILADMLESSGQNSWAASQPASLERLATGPTASIAFTGALLRQVLGTAVVLFSQHQFSALADLLSLAAPLSSSPAIRFLQGYSALGRLRKVSDKSARAALVQEAVRPFHQAAAALGPRPAYLASSQDAEDKHWLRGLIHHLQQEMTGSVTEEPLEAEQLQCFEVLMTLSEQLGCLEAAAGFAEAAAHQALQLRSSVSGAKQQELLTREGRIWTNLFVYALNTSSYQGAYAALEANPVVARRLDCLQRLLNTLCEAGALPMLAAFPYASTVQVSRDGRVQTITLLQEATQILQQRAENAELKAKPQPYQVLADFCAAKSNWRSCAAAHLSFARRLQEEGLPSEWLSKQISAALGSAANALSLVESQHAWLDDPAAATGAARPSEQLPSFGGWLEAGTPSQAGDAAPSGVKVLSLRDLVSESRAAAALSRWAPTSPHTSPTEAVKKLHSLGRYEAAVDLAEAVLEGNPQAAAVRNALSSMAAACALKQIGRSQPVISRALPTDAFTDDGNNWERLELLVQRQSRSSFAVPLWASVADAILGVDRRLKLPAWLLTLFLAGQKRQGMAGGPGDPVCLLRMYIRHGNLREAGLLAQSYLTAWLQEVSDIDRQHCMGAWFPHGLLDTLDNALANATDPSLRQLQMELAESRARLSQLAIVQTEILEKRPASGLPDPTLQPVGMIT